MTTIHLNALAKKATLKRGAGRREGCRFGVAASILTCGVLGVLQPAVAQDRPPSSINEEVNPKVIPGLVAPSSPSGRHGPLAPLADKFAEHGITFHAISIDFFTTNPTAGLVPGKTENSLYNILGVDVDLSKTTGLRGTSLHYETTIFAGNTNFGFLGQTGDSLVGYQGTYNKRTAVLSVATIEQKFLDDRLDFEIGRTHPNRYYALPACQSLDSCFQDILYYNAGFTSPLYSVYGANLAFRATNSIYAQAGAFSTNNSARIGYDLGVERQTGVLGIAELGRKTDFDTEAYPSRIALTGFFNTSLHPDLNAQTALGLTGGNFTQQGTSGFVLQGQKVIWRADGGTGSGMAPTAIAVYGSFGASLDSTTPILSSSFIGATLQAPFEGRPADRFGIKFNYEKLNSNYSAYLATANLVSGGSGLAFPGNEFVFEANAHIQLPGGLAFEPVIQYAINPNSFYNPMTPRRPRDGIFAIGTLVIPIGILLGLAPG
jgi:porin